jgi:hypothetical protein
VQNARGPPDIPATFAWAMLSASDLIRVRERLYLSRALFANFLRTNSRTLEN